MVNNSLVLAFLASLCWYIGLLLIQDSCLILVLHQRGAIVPANDIAWQGSRGLAIFPSNCPYTQTNICSLQCEGSPSAWVKKIIWSHPLTWFSRLSKSHDKPIKLLWTFPWLTFLKIATRKNDQICKQSCYIGGIIRRACNKSFFPEVANSLHQNNTIKSNFLYLKCISPQSSIQICCWAVWLESLSLLQLLQVKNNWLVTNGSILHYQWMFWSAELPFRIITQLQLQHTYSFVLFYCYEWAGNSAFSLTWAALCCFF